MEEVEQANRVAVESCHRVLSLLSQPRDQVQHRNLMVETGETVVRFKKVVSMLHNGLGHARVRKLKNPQIPSSHQSIFLDNPNCKTLTNNNNNNHHLKKSILSPNQLTSIISIVQSKSVTIINYCCLHLIAYIDQPSPPIWLHLSCSFESFGLVHIFLFCLHVTLKLKF